MSYEYDDSDRLIKISEHGENSTTFSCVFQSNDFEWIIPVYKYNGHYSEWYKGEMRKYDEHGRISIYARFDTAQVWLEKYSYPQNDPQGAICEFWHYIPNLSHSSKNKSVSETGSPAELWIFKLDLSDPKKVNGELIESYTQDFLHIGRSRLAYRCDKYHTRRTKNLCLDNLPRRTQNEKTTLLSPNLLAFIFFDLMLTCR